MLIGDPKGLHFDLEWSMQDRALARGFLRVRFNKSVIWSDAQGNGVDWTWIELFEQLARSWAYLKYEESIPPELQRSALEFLRRGDQSIEEDPTFGLSSEVYKFARRHNLATGLSGIYLPSFSILREGQNAWVVWASLWRLVPHKDVLLSLEALGNAIADRVRNESSERAELAVRMWGNREPPFSARLQIQLMGAGIRGLIPNGMKAWDYLEAKESEEDASGLLVFARMSAPISLEVRREIIDALRQIPKGESEALEELSTLAKKQLPAGANLPFQQGYALARWLRAHLNLAPQSRAEPEEILRNLGVACHLYEWESETLDAVGIWDGNHGPAVLVNRRGAHAQSLQGRRATFAHELAHVLVDRNGSLPAAEVFGGYAPLRPEQRARAFAAEFLLPHSVVEERIHNAADVQKAFSKLVEQFDVSHDLAGLHISHSPSFKSLNPADQMFVRRWQSTESEFPAAW